MYHLIWPGPAIQSATSLTLDEFPVGGQTTSAWSNLTITGTAVHDAGALSAFATTVVGNCLAIAGVNYAIASRSGFNDVALAVAPGNGSGVAAKLVTPGIIINRAPGATGSQGRNVHFTGTYSGLAPSGVDLQVTYRPGATIKTPLAVFQSWRAVSNLVASGGIWSGDVNIPLADDWMVGQARDHNAPTVLSALQANYWGVGINVFCWGQSNAAHSMQSGSILLINSQHELSRAYGHAGWRKLYVASPGPMSWDGDNANDNAIRMANELIGKLGCPIGFLRFNLPGTAIKQFLTFANGGYADNDSVNNAWYFKLANGGAIGAAGGGTGSGDLAGVNSALLYGHDFEIAIGQQGEQNATAGAGYQTALTTYYETQLPGVSGRSAAQLKCVDAILGTQVLSDDAPTPAPDSGWDGVRQAHMSFISSNSNAVWAGSTVDATHDAFTAPTTIQPGVHWCDADRIEIMKRWTQGLLKGLGVQAKGSDGPKITGGTWAIGSNQWIINCALDVGTSLVDATGSSSGTALAGFRFFVNGTLTAPTSLQITGATQITATMPAVRVGGDTGVFDYQYGANPGKYQYLQWAALTTSGAGATTLHDGASLGVMGFLVTGSQIVLSAGTGFTPGTYTVAAPIDANNVSLTASPTPSGAGSAGAATFVNVAQANFVYDNFAWAGVTYPGVRGFPLQPTVGQISV